MHLILSPHPDDAVLSLGACISAWRRAGEAVEVLTIFDGGPDGDLSPAAVEDRTRYSADPVLLRKAEDERAAEFFDVTLRSADLQELVYRFRGDGTPRCVSLEDIYGPLIADDEDVIQQVADVVSAQNHVATVHVPLATGGHSDHRIVRAAAERVLSGYVYYDDMPYAVRIGQRKPSVPWPVVDEHDLDKWITGAEIYASQLENLFEDSLDWREQFETFALSTKLT